MHIASQSFAQRHRHFEQKGFVHTFFMPDATGIGFPHLRLHNHFYRAS